MNHEIMVVDSDALSMIAVLRSLGRARYKPHAVAARPDALGFKSRFTYKFAVHPDEGSATFVPWVREYVAVHPIRAIVCGEAFLHAIHDQYAEFAHLIPDTAPSEIRQLCLSKTRVWKHLARDPATSKTLPESGVFDCAEAVASFTALRSETAVFYLKSDWGFAGAASEVPRVVRVIGTDTMQEVANSCLQDCSAVFWQRHVSGLQVGVSLWRHNGRIVAENMVRGLHTYPHHAGNMSLRATWWHDAILEDAKSKLVALNWDGVAMMEYIWNPETDEFWFIELNPRFWGYLHLDLSCNKDFPKWQMDAHFGNATEDLGPPKDARTMRYIVPGEVIYVASRCLDPQVSIVQKLKSIFEFVVLSFKPAAQADLWFRDDKFLYVRGWIRFFSDLPSRAAKIFHHAR